MNYLLFTLLFFYHPTLAQKDLTTRERALHIMNRLAYGPRPADIDRLTKNGKPGIEKWLAEQLNPDKIDDHALEVKLSQLPSLAMDPLQLLGTYKELRELVEADGKDFATMKEDSDSRKEAQKKFQAHLPPRLLEELQAQRLIRAVESQKQFNEVIFDFWWNHFNIDWSKGPIRWMASSFEKDSIRKHMFGSFYDLLRSTAHHPAMLVFLDNNVSRGPPLRPHPKNPHPPALNENYARELMELHSLGVDGGYTQKDVTELARILTGWTVSSPKDDPVFEFKEEWHDPGEKLFLGKKYTENGINEGEEALNFGQTSVHGQIYLPKIGSVFCGRQSPPKLSEQVSRSI